MLKIAIATSSYQKIGGIIKGLSRFFKMDKTEIEILFKSTESGVHEQPFDADIYIGARNRVDNIKEHLIKSKHYDYYISCEAGIESYVNMYFNVQVVCIYETKTKQYLFGKSAGWQIPSKDIEIIKETNLDSYLKKKGISSIEEILGSSYTRSEAVAQATELALAAKKLL